MKYYLPLLNKLFILFLVSQIHSIKAQNWNQITKTVASDRTNKYTSGRSINDEFGNSVGISGSYAVAGSPGDDEDSTGFNPLNNSGAIFIYKNVDGKWVKQRKNTASRRTADAAFGYSVAIDGEFIVVGAPVETEGSLSRSGAVYIYRRDEGGADNWGEVKRITAPVRSANYGNTFGYSVSISDGYLIVGAPGDDSQETGGVESSGSAYIFAKDQGGVGSWGFVRKLISSQPVSFDNFGISVGVSDGNAIVGSPGDGRDSQGNNDLLFAGSAYLFNKDFGGNNNWGQFKKLTASIRSKSDGFGASVAIDHDLVIIGATGDDLQENIGTFEFGAAYVFEKNWGAFNNWGQVKKLMAPVRRKNDNFGLAIDIENNRAIVGARLATDMEYNTPYDSTGMIYIFERNVGGNDNWGIEARRTAPLSQITDLFANSLAISGNVAFVAAIYDDRDEDNLFKVSGAGSAYFFEKDIGAVNNWGFKQKITSSTGAKLSPNYGTAISISGDFAIVGASNEEMNASGKNKILNAGAAYILYNDNGKWKEVRKIVAPYRQERDLFGISVSISGDYAVASTYWQNNGAGAAYIFKKDQGGVNNWGFLKKITASVPKRDDYFGYSVSINGENLIVGAFGDDEDEFGANNLTTSGSAYIFSKNQGGFDNWGFVKKLSLNQNREAYDSFGSTVNLSNDYAIVGALGEDHDESEGNFVDNAGAAYIFMKDQGGKDNWGLVKKLVGSDRQPGAQYGKALATDGENAIVGSPGGFVWSIGSVNIYNRNKGGENNWGSVKVMSAELPFTDPQTQSTVRESVGYNVSIEGNTALISARPMMQNGSGNAPVPGLGYAYVLGKNTGGQDNWGVKQKLTIEDDLSNGLSGAQISGKYILASVPGDSYDENLDNVIPNSGAVYFFLNSEPPLPVTLVLFDVSKDENVSLLTWSTSLETNSDYFEIQKSKDGRNWNVIGNVPAGKESDKLITYSFLDKVPFSGENLYRLKMVDRDATFAFSRIRSLTFGPESLISVYPNPAADRLFIKSETGEIELITVTSSLGQVISEFTEIPVDGIKLAQLPIGSYVIKVVKTDGTISSKKVFVTR